MEYLQANATECITHHLQLADHDDAMMAQNCTNVNMGTPTLAWGTIIGCAMRQAKSLQIWHTLQLRVTLGAAACLGAKWMFGP